MDEQILAEYGIDYDKGLRNCLGNATFYTKILTMFLSDTSFSRAAVAKENRDYKELFSSMHELKGVSGNAGFSELYNTVAPMTELVRGGGADDKEVDRLFEAANAAYHRTCEGIRLFIADI